MVTDPHRCAGVGASEAPEDPLDVAYAALNLVEEGLHDPPDAGVNSVDVGEVFLTTLAELGIERATAEALVGGLPHPCPRTTLVQCPVDQVVRA